MSCSVSPRNASSAGRARATDPLIALKSTGFRRGAPQPSDRATPSPALRRLRSESKDRGAAPSALIVEAFAGVSAAKWPRTAWDRSDRVGRRPAGRPSRSHHRWDSPVVDASTADRWSLIRPRPRISWVRGCSPERRSDKLSELAASANALRASAKLASPFDQLPDLGLQVARTAADLSEQSDRQLQVNHRLIASALVV